ncbi:MAG: ATP-binding protein [Caldimonas sp.]
MLTLLLLVLPFAACSFEDESREIRMAERSVGDGVPAMVRLPDTVRAPQGSQRRVEATYRLSVDLAETPRDTTLFMSGLIAHATIRWNGHLIEDRSQRPDDPLPRSLARLRLLDIPEEFVRTGENVIEIRATGPGLVSISPVHVGTRASLESRYEHRALGGMVGPAIVAAIVGSLALCVLLLWIKLRDPLYGYFAVGSLAWSLHTAWMVFPRPLLSAPHQTVWTVSLYSFFVAMLVIFCVRFSGWRWAWFDRGAWIASLSAPAVLYAAGALGYLDGTAQVWLLSWIGVVAVGLAAVTRYAWTHRNAEGLLLVSSGAIALAFGVRDWLVNYGGADNNHISITRYAGLLFVVFVAWMLINRFVRASRELEVVNSELEQRVTSKSAELTHALRLMRDAKDGAEAANRAKSTFLAAASHDLRQPVHALGLYMAALAGDGSRDDRPYLIHRMESSLAALETMFDSLLDLSRMDAGVIVPQAVPFDIKHMLRRLADEFAPLCASKGLRLSLRISTGARVRHVFSDPVLVERIVRNLLSNALKYTSVGGVLLTCRLRGSKPICRVQVWDTGRGIPEAERQRVFEEFYQVADAGQERTDGLGLGLSIVDRLCRLLEHPLALRSTVGRGSCFSFDVPGTLKVPVLAAQLAAVPALDGFAVAVVDDDAAVRESMEILLRRWHLRVFAGATAEDVIHRLASEREGTLGAIVADYRLRDGRTGIEAIHFLRARIGDRIPALLVSGDSSAPALDSMRASGFDCLSKPVPAARLRSWLAAAASCGRPASLTEAARQS